jgi:predicted nucleotide-binding protein
MRQVVAPWQQGRTFTLEGRVVRDRDATAVRIVQTDEPSSYYEELLSVRVAVGGGVATAGFAVFEKGVDYTNYLLFDMPPPVPDTGADLSLRNVESQGRGVVPEPDPRDVFVVHGRDKKMTSFFFDLLRRLGLKPLEFETLIHRSGSGSPYIGDIVRSGFEYAKACVIIFTGDESAQLREELGAEPAGLSPRLNVVFEAGMAMAMARERTIIVEVPPLRGLSDLDGIHAVRFVSGAPSERNALAGRLEAAGCRVERMGNDWLELPFPR